MKIVIKKKKKVISQPVCAGGQTINHCSADMCVAMSKDAASLQMLH